MTQVASSHARPLDQDAGRFAAAAAHVSEVGYSGRVVNIGFIVATGFDADGFARSSPSTSPASRTLPESRIPRLTGALQCQIDGQPICLPAVGAPGTRW